jgi:hypothetical protein
LSPGEDRATLRALEAATRNQDRVIAVENIASVGFDLASFSAIMVLMVTGLGVIATSARALSAAASARCSRWAARS